MFKELFESTIKKGDIVKIKDDFLNASEEKDYKFIVLDVGKGRAHIQQKDSKLSLPPIEVVKINTIEKVK